MASAAKGLTYGTCKNRTTMIINALAAIISYYYPATWIFPALILAGGLITLITLRRVVRPPSGPGMMLCNFHACFSLCGSAL